MASDEKIFKTLDNYFEKLDSAPISSPGMFKSDHHKEHYETIFMYSFRKYRAAIYHYSNVKNFIKTNEDVAQKLLSRGTKEDKTSKVAISMTADQYTYELSAFLEALKSSVDFLAVACCLHLPGIKSDSISPLMKIAKNGVKQGPIFNEIRQNLEWLEGLRSYRHHLVHYRIMSTSCGYEKRVINGIPKIIVHPVCIPESPPPYVPDTRIRRAMEKSSCFDYSSSKICVKTENGTEKIIDCAFKYYPQAGYIAIEEFMELQINSFEKFFTEIIDALSNLDFKTYTFSK
jgi:hypothetical protein